MWIEFEYGLVSYRSAIYFLSQAKVSRLHFYV